MKIKSRTIGAARSVVAFGVALILGAGMAVSTTASTAAAELTINVSGVNAGNGRIYVAVHRAGADVEFPNPKGMVAGIWRQAQKGGFTITLTGLKPGRYAVNGFHDTNGNGKLDSNVMGIPTEGYGFGNGARGSFGPPKFAAASVDVSAGKASIRLPFGY